MKRWRPSHFSWLGGAWILTEATVGHEALAQAHRRRWLSQAQAVPPFLRNSYLDSHRPEDFARWSEEGRLFVQGEVGVPVEEGPRGPYWRALPVGEDFFRSLLATVELAEVWVLVCSGGVKQDLRRWGWSPSGVYVTEGGLTWEVWRG